MTPEEIREIRAILPEALPFMYTPDRESPWLLAARMPVQARVSDLKAGPLAPLLSRPLVRPVVARSGGLLQRGDVAATAEPFGDPAPTPAGLAGQSVAWAQDWRAYVLSFDIWGDRQHHAWSQVSRPGANLVVQVGFPLDHASLFHRYLGKGDRAKFEFDGHPIRTAGTPTMSWARLDICLASGTALIEEVQSDWFRNVREEREWLADRTPRSRELRNLQRYEAALRAAFARDWDRVTLLAVLWLLSTEFGVSTVYMHQPGPGAVLKRIAGTAPPVSIYRKLPRGFGFAPVAEAPAFLEHPLRRRLAALRRRHDALFWRLSL